MSDPIRALDTARLPPMMGGSIARVQAGETRSVLSALASGRVVRVTPGGGGPGPTGPWGDIYTTWSVAYTAWLANVATAGGGVPPTSGQWNGTSRGGAILSAWTWVAGTGMFDATAMSLCLVGTPNVTVHVTGVVQALTVNTGLTGTIPWAIVRHSGAGLPSYDPDGFIGATIASGTNANGGPGGSSEAFAFDAAIGPDGYLHFSIRVPDSADVLSGLGGDYPFLRLQFGGYLAGEFA